MVFVESGLPRHCFAVSRNDKRYFAQRLNMTKKGVNVKAEKLRELQAVGFLS